MFWNGATGDCLLDSVAQAAWGVAISSSPLLLDVRRAMAKSLGICAHHFHSRWRHCKSRELAAQGVMLNDSQWAVEWQEMIQLAATPKQALADLHVFVLVGGCRRRDWAGGLVKRTPGTDSLHL